MIILHTLKNIRNIFYPVLLTKLFVLMINLVKQLFFTEEKNAINRFIEAILEEYDYCQKIMKKHFNKNLVMSAEDEERFQFNNICCIGVKRFDVGDNKVRDHCHLKYRCSPHWSCIINLKLTKKVPATFHNSRTYESHLVIQEIGKFDVKVSVIPNGLEKHMTFTVNKNLGLF